MAKPVSFEPERFLDGKNDELGNYAYLPFIQGPRNCLGQYLGAARGARRARHALQTIQVHEREHEERRQAHQGDSHRPSGWNVVHY